ncbi:MAG: hypothetical protein KAG98_05975, partial [Lentisphaeria bacterium]|nr:hypothetical protein [Lentisphaeria bacterium]
TDLGMSMRNGADWPIDLFISGGLTVNFVFYDVSKETSINYGTGSGDSVVDSREDDGVDFVLGMYAEAGASFNFTERWGIGAVLRYDYAFNTVETEVIEIDLSGASASLILTYNF